MKVGQGDGQTSQPAGPIDPGPQLQAHQAGLPRCKGSLQIETQGCSYSCRMCQNDFMYVRL